MGGRSVEKAGDGKAGLGVMYVWKVEGGVKKKTSE